MLETIQKIKPKSTVNQDNYKLCYIENNIAYFTRDFENQWGDDWDDAPYEHNAGPPYVHYEGNVIKLAFICPELYTPGEILPSNFSVQDINNKHIPWLSSYPRQHEYDIFAKISKKNFVKKIKLLGGVVSDSLVC